MRRSRYVTRRTSCSSASPFYVPSRLSTPAQDDILNALAYTPADQAKVVILGQDPYHGPNQAMGLSFSVPATQTKLPPSLRNIYKELSADLGCPIPATGDLTPWAQQGVLLLNTTLTVREHAANSHAKLGWSTLTDYIIERCCQLPQPVVFLAWGRFAQQMVEGKLVATGAGKATDKFCLASTHPSPLSANRATAELPAFMGSRPFSAANQLLEQHGSTPSTGLASAKNRYIKNAPDGLPSGAFCYSGQINWVRPASPPSISRLCPVINRLVTPTK